MHYCHATNVSVSIFTLIGYVTGKQEYELILSRDSLCNRQLRPAEFHFLHAPYLVVIKCTLSGRGKYRSTEGEVVSGPRDKLN